MSGPEDNPIDDHKPTKEEWEAAMSKDESTHGAGETDDEKRRALARRILGGGPPRIDPARHFDGCPARDGAPICNCGGYRAKPEEIKASRAPAAATVDAPTASCLSTPERIRRAMDSGAMEQVLSGDFRDGFGPGPAAATGGWVKCSERMPERGGFVLCWLNSQGAKCMIITGTSRADFPTTATHWMPLPPPPGQAEPGEGGASALFLEVVAAYIKARESTADTGERLWRFTEMKDALKRERSESAQVAGWRGRCERAEAKVATLQLRTQRHERAKDLGQAVEADVATMNALREERDAAQTDYRTLANLVHRAAEILRTIVTDDEANIAALAALATAKVTTLEDRAKDADNDRDAALRDTTEALADVVGWHGIFASVAAHLGCNARATTAGNEHVVERAKFASECITALWKIATSGDPEAGLDPHGYANRVIHPPMIDRGARGDGA